MSDTHSWFFGQTRLTYLDINPKCQILLAFWSNGLHCENPNNPVLFEISFWLTEKKGSGGQ